MQADPFINRPFSIALDLLRAGAAFAVLLGHAVQLQIYQGLPWITENFQHNAVALFFVLSGLVIANATLRKPGTLRDYAIARLTRILPVAYLAVAFGFVACLIATNSGLPLPAESEQDSAMSLSKLLIPLLFLSENGYGVLPVWNAPYWSLCYEVWFYALFGAAFYLRGNQRILWLALLAIGAGPRVLLLLPVWLMGVWLARKPPDSDIPLPVACIMIGSGVLGVWNLTMVTPAILAASIDLAFSVGFNPRGAATAISDYGLGLCFVAIIVGLRPVADKCGKLLERLERPILWAAGSSFTLYMFHWPILRLLQTFGISTGNPLVFAAILASIWLACGAIAAMVENRRHGLREFILARFGEKRPLAKLGSG